eukprot:9897067-Ditylum_brightwellii.AAC.1
MNKARNAIGIYALTKKVHNLYLGETARKKVTFFWFCNNVDVPNHHKIDRNLFCPCCLQRLENDDDTDYDIPDLIPVRGKSRA